ncbi:LLM class flavin-dependent oxidoreductase [Nostocoides sp. F2B08]|uniref:LLM class flavin-dependent oxidoreductase n=1 Tax=Nostocoides sp. F2B08 TaxID=2653936 RepID=UPI001263330C|nr:LLM class flavin-dependent oxidoreductase [Tetrasphaera sp. F2B08]KAB7745612.1 LLM class flavin-dependent oxidoreductase [Tetrasphaera sp. F2B08]
MTDYGHDLQFGIFPSPDAAAADRVVELTRTADVEGLDLVSIQDHPYQRRHLDTWTLLSYLGAVTTNVRLAPNVACLPLRPPAVLAKSAASLDVLTGGRVELGLGTGALWDGIVAAGGPRRSPGESVEALEEAIAICRDFWGGGGVRVRGTHYQVEGLQAGPRPVHDIPIWVGAYKPRMIRLTARLADAWIPSMGYAEPASLPALNSALDEAAEKAGRAPVLIRRMYNVSGRFGTGSGFLEGTPENWAEQLAGLTLQQGMSTFILGTDDPDIVRRYAVEVAPRVREHVAAERERRAGSGDEPHSATGDPAASVSLEERVTATVEAGLTVRPTPDDGTRLTDAVPWDEGRRPAHTQISGRTYGETDNAAPQHLVDIHNGLRSELAQLREILAQVRSGHATVGQARLVLNTMTMRQNNWTLGAYCESYCRIVTGHHTLEDRSIFPHLRASEPDLAGVIDQLETEHHEIHGLVDGLDRALVALVGTDGTGTPGQEALDGVQRALDVLTDGLLSHLAYEERELIGPLARHGFYG